MPTNDFLESFNAALKESKDTIILTHYNPDGDAIGSTLALQKYIEKKGKKSTIIVPNEFPKFLKFLPEAKNIIIGDYHQNLAKNRILQADLIFCLDFNSASRINQLGDYLLQSKAKKILIDHHQEPDTFDLMYSDTSLPATCQMVYQLIEKNNDLELISEEMADCLYTGIYTDTGGFRFRSTSPKTHQIASVLLEKGVKSDEIISNIVDTNSYSKFQLLAKMLTTMEVLPELKTSILYLTKEDMLTFGYQKGDTEGFVNYGLSIAGIENSVFLVDDLKQNFVKMSFRSKTDFDVNEFARKHFQGGGHKQAAGGKSYLSIPETINKVKEKISEYVQ